MNAIKLALALGAAMVLWACSPATEKAAEPAAPAAVATPEQELIDSGRQIAVTQCASCHAIIPGGKSPRAEAPPFDTVLSRYRADVLEEDLINGIHLGHADMPAFEFNPQGVDALIAYLKSIQKPAPPAP
jgi:mono/diheme cytochrome c family protein